MGASPSSYESDVAEIVAGIDIQKIEEVAREHVRANPQLQEEYKARERHSAYERYQAESVKARRHFTDSLNTIDSGRIIYGPIGNPGVDGYDRKALEDQKAIEVIAAYEAQM